MTCGCYKRDTVTFTPIANLNFGLFANTRVHNCITNENFWRERQNPPIAPILTIGDLAKMTEAECLRMANFGRKSLRAIKATLVQHGLHLGM